MTTLSSGHHWYLVFVEVVIILVKNKLVLIDEITILVDIHITNLG